MHIPATDNGYLSSTTFVLTLSH